MIKKLIAAIALLTALLAIYSGASFLSGLRIQSQSYGAVDAINIHLARTWSDQARISARHYQRGIFSSEATFALTLPPTKDAADAQKREILFVNRITHGPLPIAHLLKADFSPVGAIMTTETVPTPWTEQLFNAEAKQGFITGHTRVDLDGHATLTWSSTPVEFRQDALRLKLGSAQLNAQIGPRFIQRKGDFALESLNVTDGQTTLDLKTIKAHTTTTVGGSGLALGVHIREIGRLTWASVNTPTIDLEKFKIRTELNDDDADISGETDIQIGALSIAQQKLGAFKLALSYDKLTERSLAPLAEIYNRLMTRNVLSILEPQPVSTAELKKIWIYVQGLLKSNPNFRVNPLVWETPEGKSQLTLSTSLSPAELANSGIGLRENPIQSLDATLTISQTMVNALVLQTFQKPGSSPAKAKGLAERESKRLADMAVQLKLGRVQNGRLVSHFHVEDNELRINGQRTSAEPLLKLLSTYIPSRLFDSRSTASQEGPDEALSLQHLEPAVMGSILSDSDFTYEETRDADGDLVLRVAPGDSGAKLIEIIFSGCRNDPTCEDVLLRATYSTDQAAPLKFINDWNLRNRWARVFVNEAGSPILEMDISAYGGIGQDAIEGMVSTFFKLVRDFSAELKNAEKKNNEKNDAELKDSERAASTKDARN